MHQERTFRAAGITFNVVAKQGAGVLFRGADAGKDLLNDLLRLEKEPGVNITSQPEACSYLLIPAKPLIAPSFDALLSWTTQPVGIPRARLRVFPAAGCAICPRCSVSSASRAVSSTFRVSWFSSPPGPTKLTPRSLACGEQTLRKLLLIDDLSRHRIDHHPCHRGRGLRHGRLLSDQAGPHTPYFLQTQLNW
jgi:hypothetical protein